MQDASLSTLRQLTSLLLLTLALSLSLRAEGERRYFGQVGMIEVKVSSREHIPQDTRIPILRLGSDDQVHISLDLLGHESPQLTYRLRHCNADGNPSNISSIECILGFDNDYLEPPKASYGTRIPYQHYELTLPNERSDFKLSGQYIIDIAPIGDGDSILASIPIAVSEETAHLSASWAPLALLGARETHQQMDVIAQDLPLGTRAHAELTLVVVQNGIYRKTYPHPSSAYASEARYEGLEGIAFEGGNEYRRIECTNEYDMRQGIESMSLQENIVTLQASPSEPRVHLPYQHQREQSGRSLISTSPNRASATEVDYTLTTFVLLMPYRPGGDIVLAGDAMRYLPTEHKTMHYDDQLRGYVCTLPLKMGYHEWLYLWQSQAPQETSPYNIEGSHRETTNDYTLLLYHRSPIDRGDRLIATLEVSR